jgi:flagella basal body P-ring formation protein FlgA
VKNPSVKLVDMRFSSASHRFSGTLLVQGSNAGAEPMMIPLSGRATPMVRVPVLARPVSRGESLGDADIEMTVMPVNKVVSDVITDIATFKGKELKRDIGTGQWVRGADLRAAQLVRRGNIVTVGIMRGGLSVTTRGRAMGDAGVGDTVRVMNASTNRVIEGVVQSDGSVAIPAGI